MLATKFISYANYPVFMVCFMLFLKLKKMRQHCKNRIWKWPKPTSLVFVNQNGSGNTTTSYFISGYLADVRDIYSGIDTKKNMQLTDMEYFLKFQSFCTKISTNPRIILRQARKEILNRLTNNKIMKIKDSVVNTFKKVQATCFWNLLQPWKWCRHF